MSHETERVPGLSDYLSQLCEKRKAVPERVIKQAQQLLKVARMSPLYPGVKRDAIFAYGLQHRLSILEVQDILAEIDLPLLASVHVSRRAR